MQFNCRLHRPPTMDNLVIKLLKIYFEIPTYIYIYNPHTHLYYPLGIDCIQVFSHTQRTVLLHESCI